MLQHSYENFGLQKGPKCLSYYRTYEVDLGLSLKRLIYSFLLPG